MERRRRPSARSARSRVSGPCSPSVQSVVLRVRVRTRPQGPLAAPPRGALTVSRTPSHRGSVSPPDLPEPQPTPKPATTDAEQRRDQAVGQRDPLPLSDPGDGRGPCSSPRTGRRDPLPGTPAAGSGSRQTAKMDRMGLDITDWFRGAHLCPVLGRPALALWTETGAAVTGVAATGRGVFLPFPIVEEVVARWSST